MEKVICWWSGGITSAVACKIAIDIYGAENCRVIMLDTKNEHEDTYRFLKDCEKWYKLPIELLSSDKYESIRETWYKHLSLNTANGAICSSKLKRSVREKWEKTNTFSFQVFGFEFNKHEFNRALSFKLNHSHTNPIFPLLMFGYDKDYCIKAVQNEGIQIPEPYRLGYNNNNCLSNDDGGCTQGGIGYWQKLQRELPHLYEKRAIIEHELTDLKGHPVTMMKDQSNKAKKSTIENKYANLVFLKKHPNYPNNKCLADMKGREPKPLTDCNGFCGVDDLISRSDTENEINKAEL
jgi:hypothetical protein